jgi:hypothetical protein
MSQPITKICARCGTPFKVAKDVDFNFSHICDRCIIKSQPYIPFNAVDSRIDAHLDWKEADAADVERELIHGGK